MIRRLHCLACLLLTGLHLEGADAIEIADGLSPADAAARMTVPDGFRVMLAAGEPLVHQPIAFTIDHRGRLWIAEAYTYPNRATEGHGRDKIVILEDTDGDGTFEKRKVFIEGLNLISGIELGFGGVWVGAAPYLMFIPDRDGDDRPDRPQPNAPKPDVKFPRDVPPGVTVLLDGFGWQDTHETLNSFLWGPDGWLYACHGVFTHSRVGQPGTGDHDRVGLNAGVWRYHPTRHKFEVFAHGTSNPWGVDFNDKGQAFITACVIPHLWHVIQGGRYHRQGGQHFNPHTYDDLKTIADHLHYVGKISDHAWWGHEPKAPIDTLAAGGGHAHCGAMVYLGNNWPAPYRNQIFMHNVHGNRINECLLENVKSGYVGRRAPDTMIANDRWFRGINLKYGPDGSVYLIDWYDKNACHRTTPEIWDRTNGRVYQISYEGSAKPINLAGDVKTSLAKLTSDRPGDLVDLLNHPNEWFVRMARRRLQEQINVNTDPPSTTEPLSKMLWERFQQADGIPEKLRLLWTIHAVVGIPSAMSLELLNLAGSENEYLRAWVIQLELEDEAAPEPIRSKMALLAKDDPSPVVRLFLASSLQRLPLEQRWPLAFALTSHEEDSTDHNIPLVLWYGIEPLVEADPARVIQLAKSSRIERIRRYLVRRCASATSSLELTLDWLTETRDPDTQDLILDELRIAFEGRANIPQPRSWTPAFDRIRTSSRASVRNKADQIAIAFGDKRILPHLRSMLVDANTGIEERRRALELILKGKDPDAVSAILTVLDVDGLRDSAIRALAAYDDSRIADALLGRYKKFTESEKRDAINTLVGRRLFADRLFDELEKGSIPRTDVHAYHIQQMLGFDDSAFSDRIKSIWGEVRATSEEKKASIARHKGNLKPSRLRLADLGNGRRLFARTCASCHTLFGDGGKVGPDITGSNRANLDYILENILDPSALVGKDYQTTLIVTRDGRVITGLRQKETDSAITLRTINETVVVARTDIEESSLSSQSLMPEGQFNLLTPDEQRDLIAYLASPVQVPLRGPKSPIDPRTRQVPDALEGETMKIVGKTDGQITTQQMNSFQNDAWSGDAQLWWTGATTGSQLDLELPVAVDGIYDVELCLTMAVDYGIVQPLIDDEIAGLPIDCYQSEVLTTGLLSLGQKHLKSGAHTLRLKIIGANPQSVRSYMVGIDYVRLSRTAGGSARLPNKD